MGKLSLQFSKTREKERESNVWSNKCTEMSGLVAENIVVMYVPKGHSYTMPRISTTTLDIVSMVTVTSRNVTKDLPP